MIYMDCWCGLKFPKISKSSPKSLLSELLQHQDQQFISRFASTVVSSWFSINVLEFYQITQLSVQLSSIYANWSYFHIKQQLTISCILIRINGTINEKRVSISAKLTIKRLDITLLLRVITPPNLRDCSSLSNYSVHSFFFSLTKIFYLYIYVFRVLIKGMI